MKRFRLGSALLLLMLALGFSLVPIQRSTAAEGKCNCLHPNTGVYGIKNGTECPQVDCWIDIE